MGGVKEVRGPQTNDKMQISGAERGATDRFLGCEAFQANQTQFLASKMVTE